MFQRRRQAGGQAGENGEYPISRSGTAELLEIIVGRPVCRLQDGSEGTMKKILTQGNVVSTTTDCEAQTECRAWLPP